ncbi:CPBP family intramembrane glutamic endopeptidase [Rhizosphaericola mali]|uniref:CPBP family intramembrane metalloprotease n=1 Tax=Rhizosphaericola mali TaxID=2545455 RepID=A0A5P2G646_9BACT|nr:CPBP family intramembrane glutamic endopeptidase [Rhizosphaericola mali]QES89220.1 CPBP family intramembrane metalloprotease [Rhizosphaericola mali]
MKNIITKNPIISYLIICFLITYFFWFLPVLINLPKDVTFAYSLIGTCGPLLAGYFITLIRSNQKITISSKTIFLIAFLGTAITLGLRIYYTGKGLPDANGKIPTISEITPIGCLLFFNLCLIIGINFSNSTNQKLKENYIKTALFDKTKIKWYFFALLIFPIINITSYWIAKIIGTNTTDYFVKTDPKWFIGLFSTYFFFGGNEEYGWRGFFQKEIQKKYCPLVVVIIMTVVWSFWHFPLYFNGFYSTGGIKDLLPRFVFTLPISIIFTWLYNKSQYALLSTMILHAMLNNTDRTLGSSENIAILLMSFFCVYCIISDKMWKRNPYNPPI